MVAGSASDRGAAIRDSPLAPNIITDAQVRRYGQGAPARALLLWWQAIQYQDTDIAREFTTRRVLREFGRERLTRLARKVGSALGGLRIVKTRVRGDRADIRVAIVTYEDGEVNRAATLPLTLSVTRESGAWKVDELRYLNVLARSFEVG